MYIPNRILLCFFCWCGVVNAYPSNDLYGDDYENMEKADAKHLTLKQVRKELEVFPCREPQKKLVKVSELPNYEGLTDTKPEVVVVHRCDDSAVVYCKEYQHCVSQPSDVEDVVMEIVHLRQKINITLTNHTMCSCGPV